jgi:hypothetical protein
MGVFQLTDVAESHGLKQVIADWTVGKAALFGAPGTKVTLTAFVVSGTAPGRGLGRARSCPAGPLRLGSGQAGRPR